jgi:hypothetical protein
MARCCIFEFEIFWLLEKSLSNWKGLSGLARVEKCRPIPELKRPEATHHPGLNGLRPTRSWAHSTNRLERPRASDRATSAVLPPDHTVWPADSATHHFPNPAHGFPRCPSPYPLHNHLTEENTVFTTTLPLRKLLPLCCLGHEPHSGPPTPASELAEYRWPPPPTVPTMPLLLAATACAAHRFTCLPTAPPHCQREGCLPASLLSAQRSAIFTVQQLMSNWGEQAPGLWTWALLWLPDTVAIHKASGEQRQEHPGSCRLRKVHSTIGRMSPATSGPASTYHSVGASNPLPRPSPVSSSVRWPTTVEQLLWWVPSPPLSQMDSPTAGPALGSLSPPARATGSPDWRRRRHQAAMGASPLFRVWATSTWRQQAH